MSRAVLVRLIDGTDLFCTICCNHEAYTWLGRCSCLHAKITSESYGLHGSVQYNWIGTKVTGLPADGFSIGGIDLRTLPSLAAKDWLVVEFAELVGGTTDMKIHHDD